MKKIWKYLTKAISTATIVARYLPEIKSEVDDLTGCTKAFVKELLKVWQE